MNTDNTHERAIAYEIAVARNAHLETQNRKLVHALTHAQLKLSGDARAIPTHFLLELIRSALKTSA